MQGSAPTQGTEALPDSPELKDAPEVVTEEPPAEPESARLPDDPPTAEADKAEAAIQANEKPATTPEPDASARRGNDPAKRIGKLTRELREAERRSAYLEGMLAGKAEAAKPVVDEKPVDNKPKMDDFDSLEDYADALADYKVGAGKEPQAERREAIPTQAELEAPELKDIRGQSYRDAKAEFPDLDDVLLDPQRRYTKVMADVLAYDPDSAKILYKMGEDPEELKRIAELTPAAAAKVVRRFADEYHKANPTTETPAEPEPDDGDDEAEAEPQTLEQPGTRMSRAAPVPRSLAGRASTSSSPVDLALSGRQGDYEAAMNARDRARRGR